jgi:hypothetical protein
MLYFFDLTDNIYWLNVMPFELLSRKWIFELAHFRLRA